MMRVWRLTSVCMSVCLSVAYIGPKSRTERPRKTKIGTEVAHITSDTTFKVKRSKVNSQGTGAYCGGIPHSLLMCGIVSQLTALISLPLPPLNRQLTTKILGRFHCVTVIDIFYIFIFTFFSLSRLLSVSRCDLLIQFTYVSMLFTFAITCENGMTMTLK